MENNSKIYQSLLSVLNEKSTEDEKKQVDDWLCENERNKLFFKALKETKFSSFNENTFVSKESVFRLTQSKIDRSIYLRRSRIWQSIATVAVFLLFLTGSWVIFKQSIINPVIIEMKCPAGNTTTLTLADGTIVNLNAGSSIRYPSVFQGKNREVFLSGEACFEVAENENMPFVVYTDEIKVQALGTQFNLNSYRDENEIVTTLLEGSISVDMNSSSSDRKIRTILKPDQQLVYNRNTEQYQVLKVESSLFAVWKDGQCYFEQEKFSEIIKKLERQFGVNIKISSAALKDQIFSGFFSKKEGVLQILNSFKKYENFDFKVNDKEIEIFENT